MAPNFLALATTLENLGGRWLLAKKVNFMPWVDYLIVIRYNLTKSRQLYLLLSPFLLMMIIIIFFFPLHFHYYSVPLEQGWCSTFNAQFSTVKCQAGCKALEYFRNLNFINFAMQSDNLLVAFTETLFVKTIAGMPGEKP